LPAPWACRNTETLVGGDNVNTAVGCLGLIGGGHLKVDAQALHLREFGRHTYLFDGYVARYDITALRGQLSCDDAGSRRKIEDFLPG
jgi:hypothetical protein